MEKPADVGKDSLNLVNLATKSTQSYSRAISEFGTFMKLNRASALILAEGHQ
jgi:hypothetical protein